MQLFTIDGGAATTCNTCCCLQASAEPGGSDKWVLNYAPVALTAGAQGLTQGTCFDIEKIENCPSCNDRDKVSPEFVSSETGVPYAGDLVAVVDAPGKPLDFKNVVFSQPNHGHLELNSNGTYTYTPRPGFTGYDRFFWRVSIDGGTYIVSETILGVGEVTPPTTAQLTPDLKITCVTVLQKKLMVSFVMEASPALVPGDIYRLNVRQGIRDCDCCWHSQDCFDIHIGTC